MHEIILTSVSMATMDFLSNQLNNFYFNPDCILKSIRDTYCVVYIKIHTLKDKN